jgi:hypothetical protein
MLQRNRETASNRAMMVNVADSNNNKSKRPDVRRQLKVNKRSTSNNSERGESEGKREGEVYVRERKRCVCVRQRGERERNVCVRERCLCVRERDREVCERGVCV